MMNALARSVLTLYAYDDLPNDTSIQRIGTMYAVNCIVSCIGSVWL